MLTPPLGPEGGDCKPLKLLLVSKRLRSGQVCGRGRCVGVVGIYLGIEAVGIEVLHIT